MSLKHQNSGKWAKSKAIMAKYDEGVMISFIICIACTFWGIFPSIPILTVIVLSIPVGGRVQLGVRNLTLYSQKTTLTK